MTDQRASIHECITHQIVAAIEAGTGPFRMPWHHDGSSTSRPVNIATEKRYRGANTILLWAAADSAGYASGIWGTYRQWTAKGARVRRGERATTIVVWKPVGGDDGSVAEASGRPGKDRRRFFARGYSVFNRCQVDGYQEPAIPTLREDDRIARADAFFDALGIPLTSGAASAFYRVFDDRIHMPAFGAFVDPISYYGVLYHEAGHATGAKHRLDRNLEKRFSTGAVAIEEIVAELTAAFILADLGLSFHPRDDHAAYVESWISSLRNDTRAIFSAATLAQVAADWMHAQQPAGEPVTAARAIAA